MINARHTQKEVERVWREIERRHAKYYCRKTIKESRQMNKKNQVNRELLKNLKHNGVRKILTLKKKVEAKNEDGKNSQEQNDKHKMK